MTPGAKAFLVKAGADVSYQKAANLLSRNGSRVSATTVTKTRCQVYEAQSITKRQLR